MLHLSNRDEWRAVGTFSTEGGALERRTMAAIFLNLRTAPTQLQYPNHCTSGELDNKRFLQYCSRSGDMNSPHNSLHYMGGHRKSTTILYIRGEASPNRVKPDLCKHYRYPSLVGTCCTVKSGRSHNLRKPRAWLSSASHPHRRKVIIDATTHV